MAKTWQIPQTRYFIIGVSLGYLGLIYYLGWRSLVLISGGIISIGAIALWFWETRSSHIAPSANLLQGEVFVAHLNYLNRQIPAKGKSIWLNVRQQAQTIQQLACQISQKQPTLIPDLLESLHTVIDLVEQLARALQVKERVRTPHYQKLAQQQLESSLSRLQETSNQFQLFSDRLAVEGLEMRSPVVSQRLQILIADNQRGIFGN